MNAGSPHEPSRSEFPAAPERVGVVDILRQVLDPNTWIPWHGPPRDSNGWPDAPTAETMPNDDIALITGEGHIAGHRCALIASNFAYRGGSLGVAASEQLINAVDHARELGLPILASPCSGGARLQEGPRALIQMLRVTAAVEEFRRAQLPYLVYLRHPSLGATMATWGALGHLTFAQPGSLLGLIGPRAAPRPVTTEQPREQPAEAWERHGMIDGVVAPHDLKTVLGTTLTALYGQTAATGASATGPASPVEARRIAIVGQPEQTLGSEVLDTVSRSAVPILPGRSGTRAAAVLCRLGDTPCVLVSTVWTAEADSGHLSGPEELRLVRHAARLADDLALPLVSLVETPGPDASPEAELAGICQEIALCTADLLRLPTPTVSVLTGAAVGGPAIAMLPADRVLGTSHAWLSSMSPHRVARVTAASGNGPPASGETGAGPEQLRALGIVDREIPAPTDASRQDLAAAVITAVEQELHSLRSSDPRQRMAQRRHRYLSLGSPSSPS